MFFSPAFSFHIHFVPAGTHQNRIHRGEEDDDDDECLKIASEFTIPGAVMAQTQHSDQLGTPCTGNFMKHSTQSETLSTSSLMAIIRLAAATWLGKKVTHQGRK